MSPAPDGARRSGLRVGLQGVGLGLAAGALPCLAWWLTSRGSPGAVGAAIAGVAAGCALTAAWVVRRLRWRPPAEPLVAGTDSELHERVRDLTLLAELSRSLGSSLDHGRVLAVVSRQLAAGLGYDWVSFSLYDAEAGALTPGGHAGSIPDGLPIVARACVPLLAGAERVGVLEVARRGLAELPETELDLLRQVARQAALAVRNGRLTRRIMELAVTDSLTGLANRGHLMRCLSHELQRAERFGSPLGLLMVDVDYFKEFNDRYGHLAGDRVLAGAAALIAGGVRAIDTVGRYGGEEFVLLLPRASKADALDVADKLRARLSAWHPEVPGLPDDAHVTISVGVAAFPLDADTAEGLLGAADAALYRAKGSGRDRIAGADARRAPGPPAPAPSGEDPSEL